MAGEFYDPDEEDEDFDDDEEEFDEDAPAAPRA